jgi:hypothetical protein
MGARDVLFQVRTVSTGYRRTDPDARRTLDRPGEPIWTQHARWHPPCINGYPAGEKEGGDRLPCSARDGRAQGNGHLFQAERASFEGPTSGRDIVRTKDHRATEQRQNCGSHQAGAVLESLRVERAAEQASH